MTGRPGGRRRGGLRRGVPGAAVAAFLAFLGPLVACSSGDVGRGSPTTRPGRARPTTTAAVPTAPLTGLPDPAGVSAHRPVVAVKVDNHPAARPQSGLEQADVVWTEVVEGQLTRFLAMYQSTAPEVVGPVRSVRRTDPLIVWPLGGVFAFSGGARDALSALAAAPVVAVDEARAGSAMFRDRARPAPHNLYVRPDRLWDRGGEPVPPPALFTYRPEGPAGGAPAAEVGIGYPGSFRVTYRWDAASGAWRRFEGGREFLGRGGGQIAATNVVVMAVPYLGGVGRPGSEARLVGEGEAWVLGAGRAVPARWVRPRREEPARLLDAAGRPVPLRPGRTWVELPDPGHPVTVVPEGGAGAGR